MYKVIQPEVIVGLGEKTVFLEKEQPFKTVLKLHVQLEDWLGDDIMECYPCYLVTENVEKSLREQNFTGYEIDDVEISKSEYFADNYNLVKELPKFYWLKINGKVGENDLYLGDGKNLYASELLIKFLSENFSTRYLDIEPERNEFDDLLDQMIAESKNKE